MKKSHILTILLLFSLSTLLLAACGGGDEGESDDSGDSGGGTVEMEVIMNDIYFGESNDNVDNPPTWTAPAGASVKVEMVNNGALDHNWAVVKLGETLPDVINDAGEVEDALLTNGGTVAAGDSSTWRFSAPSEAGDYQVICTIAGHYPAMQGTFTVEAP